jgi:hypothetical protein
MLRQWPYALRWWLAALFAAAALTGFLLPTLLGGSAQHADVAPVRSHPGLQPRVANQSLPAVGLSPPGTFPFPFQIPFSPAILWDVALHEGGGHPLLLLSQHVGASGRHLAEDAARHSPVRNVTSPVIVVSRLRPPLSLSCPVTSLPELSLPVCRELNGAAEWGGSPGAAVEWSSVGLRAVDFWQQRATSAAAFDSVCSLLLANGPGSRCSFPEILLSSLPLAVAVGPDQPLVRLVVIVCWVGIASCMLFLAAFLYCCHYYGSNDSDIEEQPDNGTYSPRLLKFTAMSCTLVGRCRLCPHARGRRMHGFGTRYRVLGPSQAGDLEVYISFSLGITLSLGPHGLLSFLSVGLRILLS